MLSMPFFRIREFIYWIYVFASGQLSSSLLVGMVIVAMITILGHGVELLLALIAIILKHSGKVFVLYMHSRILLL